MKLNQQDKQTEQENGLRSLLPLGGLTALLGMYVDKKYMPKATDWERFKASYPKWLQDSKDLEYIYKTPELFVKIARDSTYGELGLNLKNIKLGGTAYDSQLAARNLGSLGAKVLRTFEKTNPYLVTIGGNVVNEKIAQSLYKKGFGYDPLESNMVRSQNASEFMPGVLEVGDRHIFLDSSVRDEYLLAPFVSEPTLRESKLGGGNSTLEQIDKAIAFNEKTYNKRALLSHPMTRIATPLGLIAGGTLAYVYSKIKGDSEEEAQDNAAQFASGGGLLGMYQPKKNIKYVRLGNGDFEEFLSKKVLDTQYASGFDNVKSIPSIDYRAQVPGSATGMQATTQKLFGQHTLQNNLTPPGVDSIKLGESTTLSDGQVKRFEKKVADSGREYQLAQPDVDVTAARSQYEKSSGVFRRLQESGFLPKDVRLPDFSTVYSDAKAQGIKVNRAEQIEPYIFDRIAEAQSRLLDPQYLSKKRLEGAQPKSVRIGQEYVSPKSGKTGTITAISKDDLRVKLSVDGVEQVLPKEILQKLKYTGNKGYYITGQSYKFNPVTPFAALAGYGVSKLLGRSEEESQQTAAATGMAGGYLHNLSNGQNTVSDRLGARFMPAEEHARLSLFKGLRGTGLDLTQMARLSVPGVIPNPKDDLTGFTRGIEARDQTAQRAIEFTQKTGEVGHYISADIANLGGLNSTLGETGANKVYKRFTDIYAEELKAAGDRVGAKDFSLSNFRQGGDEFSSIVYGLKPDQIDDAVTRAEIRIQDFVKSEGLDAIEHPKYKGDVTRRGTGITTAYAPLDPARSIEETYGIVDKQLEANKKAVRQSMDRRDVERLSERLPMAQALDLPYNLQTGDILDADKFAAHLEAMPAYEQTLLLDRLAKASSQEANSWKQGLPQEEIARIQKSQRLERRVEARPDWSKLNLGEAPLQEGILSGARQNQYKSAKLRGEKPPNLAYFLAGEPGVAVAEAMGKFVKSSQQSVKSGYIPQAEFDARVSAIAQNAGVPESVARSAVAQGREVDIAEKILVERLPPKPVLSMQQAKQTIAEMQQKYSGGKVGIPDVAIAPRNEVDRLAGSLKSKASYINQVGGDIGLEALQGADYAAKSLRRGENAETAIARAGTASATSLGASKIIGAALAKAPVPGIVKVGAQFVGAGLAAFGADELISKAIGFDAEKAQRYSEREHRALGETEDDRNKYSFQYVYNRATEGNQVADTIRPATDIAGSIIDSFNPVHIAKNLGESLANYTNRDLIAQSMYLNQRSDSMDAFMSLKPEKGMDNAGRSRSLALQNLANESGQSVQRTGRFDGDTYEVLIKQGYSQQQIQDYLRGKTKVLGRPMVSDRYRQVAEAAGRRSLGKEVYTPAVTGQSLSEALSQVRKSANLKPGQKLDAGTVQGVFDRLAGKLGSVSGMSSLAGGLR